jgi:ribosomal protein L4
VVVVHHGQVNVYNLLLYDKVLVTRDAMLALQERLSA